MGRNEIFRRAELAKLTHGQLLSLLLEVNDVITPIRECKKATMLASLHGTEWGDDKQFDELYWSVYRAQKAVNKLEKRKV